MPYTCPKVLVQSRVETTWLSENFLPGNFHSENVMVKSERGISLYESSPNAQGSAIQENKRLLQVNAEIKQVMSKHGIKPTSQNGDNIHEMICAPMGRVTLSDYERPRSTQSVRQGKGQGHVHDLVHDSKWGRVHNTEKEEHMSMVQCPNRTPTTKVQAHPCTETSVSFTQGADSSYIGTVMQ